MTPEADTWTIYNFGELVECFEVDNGLLGNEFCEECVATFKTRSSLQMHISLEHNKNVFKCVEYNATNSCEVCDATLKPVIDLEAHELETWVSGTNVV